MNTPEDPAAVDLTQVPIGSHVRIVDTFEGELLRAEFANGGADLRPLGRTDGYLQVKPVAIGWKRSIEILELPRPDEPTGEGSIVRARRGNERRWHAFERIAGRWEDTTHRVDWSQLKDITVLYPGGAE